ncbi:MAG: cob(I)yrinic acid a,c-diamide adenosyltransferase [Oligoflexia bacterium]|nr:cob(I)yrinic acid a,c-diamide adenosyltransferase [Oligoflexia bacterium]
MSAQGQIHVYTGDGKGKTTAAVGLTIRAAGADQQVAFIQFDKGSEAEDFYSERKILRAQTNIDVQPTGKIRMMPTGQFRFSNSPPDFEEAKRGLELAAKAVSNQKYQLVICDEILSCILTTLVKEDDVLELLDVFEKSGRTCDLVLTGRTLPEAIKARADLVTEMKLIKHYFNKGLPARKGIEF